MIVAAAMRRSSATTPPCFMATREPTLEDSHMLYPKRRNTMKQLCRMLVSQVLALSKCLADGEWLALHNELRPSVWRKCNLRNDNRFTDRLARHSVNPGTETVEEVRAFYAIPLADMLMFSTFVYLGFRNAKNSCRRARRQVLPAGAHECAVFTRCRKAMTRRRLPSLALGVLTCTTARP
jgi:hypothetical protein